MKKAVIFDMDGLMIDSERVIYSYYMEVLSERGYEFNLTFYKQFLGKTRVTVMKMLCDHYGSSFPVQEVWDDIHERAKIHMQKEVPLKNGLIELLTYLKENNIKTMVATSSDRWRVDMILEVAKLNSYFDDVICGNEVKNGKPDPEIFLTAAKKLEVETKDALVLEDSESGILAAYRGNIDVICIPDLKFPEEEYANKTTAILNSLEEVIDYLKK